MFIVHVFCVAGDVLVGCFMKKTQVMRARLPKSRKTVTIPRNSAILFTLLPKDGDEGGLLAQTWEGTFNVSELIRVEPLPPVSVRLHRLQTTRQMQSQVGIAGLHTGFGAGGGQIELPKILGGGGVLYSR